MASDASLKYRPDIDGLRAIAVLLVIGFHAFPGRVPGGFVGVDVFFVISGYLISGLILRDLRLGTFSIGHFYARRVRRIFPALTVVLVACLVVGHFTLTPTESADLGYHAAAGAAFVSNLALWAQSGYFAAASESKPLLHLWSLGVEEQFYIVWPLTLAFLYWKTARPWLLVMAIALASFALNVYLVHVRPEAAFYCPGTRLWELLIGGLLACRVESIASSAADSQTASWQPVPWARAVWNIASVSGLVLVLVAAFALDGSQSFPGWRAGVPVFGTAMTIAAGPSTWLNRFVLARPLTVFVGLFSYPLYLWHWPALALIPVLDVAWSPDQERVMKLLAIAGAVVAAYLTYRWVEWPVRRALVGSTRTLCLALAVPFLAGAAVALNAPIAHNPSNRQQREIALLLDRLQARRAELYRDGRCFLGPTQDETAFSEDCVVAAEGRQDRGGTLLWGDSHAAHLFPGIHARGTPSGFAQFSASACPPILGYLARGRPHCAGINQWILEWVKEHRPETILLAANWISYDEYQLVGETIAELKALGTRRVVLIGPVASFRERVPDILARQSTDRAIPERILNSRLGRLWRVDSELKELAAKAGAEYASPLALVCDQQECLVALGGTAAGMLAFDQTHLTEAGSKYVVERLLDPYLP